MKTLINICLFLTGIIGFAQDSISYQNCVAIALENNWDILISKDLEVVAKNNATPGNVNLLPTISLNGGVNGSITNVRQQFITEDADRVFQGAQSSSQNAQVGLNYNLYQGNTRINQLKNLRIESKTTELQTKKKIEETMVLVGQYYYQLVGFQENLKLQKEILEVSKERFKRVSYQYEFGNALKIDVLNSEVNLNSDSLRYLTAEKNLFQAQQHLLLTLGTNDQSSIQVYNKISFLSDLDKDNLKSDIQSKNTTALLEQENVRQAALEATITSGNRAPTLGSNASYGINTQQSESGIVSSSVSHGLNIGLTLSFDLYSGNKKNIERQNAKIQIKIAENIQSNTNDILKKNLENAWNEYSFQMNVIRLQKKNIKTNEVNFKRSRELFQFGQITSTQYREAQINYLSSRFDFILSHTTAKIEELKLLQLGGRLIE